MKAIKGKENAAFNDHVVPYDRAADVRAAEYDRLEPALVNAVLSAHLPATPARILDVGAGSGRDAAWLAGMGHSVVAVEPSPLLRGYIEEKANEAGGRIDVRDGMLPDLASLRADEKFDVINMTAVWQHVTPKKRRDAFNKAASHLKPGGKLVISLREGPPPADRKMYRVSHAATARMARAAGMTVLSAPAQEKAGDLLGRSAVRWTVFVGQKSR